MDSINIRSATQDELNIVVSLNERLFKEDAGEKDPFALQSWPREHGEKYFFEKINNPDAVCLVAVVDGSIVGYLSGSLKEIDSWRPVKRSEIDDMYVLPEFRSHGLGAKLVSNFKQWSQDKGVSRIVVFTYAVNDRTIKFYQKMGFTPYALELEAAL